MTENTTTTGGAEAESEGENELGPAAESETEIVSADDDSATEFVPAGPANEEAALLPEELIEIDDDGADEEDVVGSGAVSGGFGFAGLALAIVSLTTSWTSDVVVSHSQDSESAHATTQLTFQQQLDSAVDGWHTQAWWGLAFAVGAVLFGAGSLLSPSILLSGRAPGWAKAGATAAVIVGLVGVLLAILTLTGVIGANITAPPTTSTTG
jgi:hypothetical protein